MAWTRAIWRLTRNALVGSPRRTRLLAFAVAASVTLLTAIACALESLNAGIERGMAGILGKADIRVKRVGEDRFDIAALERVRAEPMVESAAPRAKATAVIRRAGVSRVGLDTAPSVTAMLVGIDPDLEYRVTQPDIAPGGARVQRQGQVTLDAQSASTLGVRVGDTVEMVTSAEPLRLVVVGLTALMPVKAMQRSEATVALPDLWMVTGFPDRVNEIQVVVSPGADAAKVAARLSSATGFPKDLTAEPTAAITSGIRAKTRAARLVYLLASTLGFIASAFIVLTGLTTNLLERQRELAIMRCIGATRAQLALAQLGVGAALGLVGAAIGIPLGAALVFTLIALFRDRFSAGFEFSPMGMGAGIGGALLAGIGGALWPALRAARSSPLSVLAVHAKPPRRRWVVACALAAAVALAWQAGTVWLVPDAETSFWLYATTGLPAMFVGYFLAGVPVCLVVTRLASGQLSKLLRIPTTLLGRFTAQHPFRNGFTAGALMVGLALMTVIWTVGGSVFRDVLGGFRFPDAFVQSWHGLTPDIQRRIEALPGVEGTCAVALITVDGGKTFGVSRFGTRQTTFIGFEPEPFFRLTNLKWESGDPQYAKRRLSEGGAVIVAREFLTAQKGYKVGDRFPLVHKGIRTEFEIVGAVSSPGLELLNSFFDIGKQYAEQAMSAVFGSRDDLRRVFGTDAIHLIQVSLRPGTDDSEATAKLREIVGASAMVGSGREIKELIGKLGGDAMLVASVVAVGAMLIACLGVGNIVTAGIDARRFEFGVLRAVGAEASLVSRLVLGEVVLVALAACVLGTALGLQGSMAGTHMHHALLGLQTRAVPPWGAIASGWAILIALALASAWPIVRRAASLRPRELIAGAAE